jgi:peptidoglycan/xylan/chitin deacetylase (PgdA/CDA1 family)
MTDSPAWPGGARAAVSVTVDNLGEAAEIELGLRDADVPLGGHYSVTTALPIMLDALAAAGLPATFFVEGINAEAYPDALHAIGAGHELAYHAWCHEDWSALDAGAEVANLDRGLAALNAIGIDAVGFRPPGGRLTPRTLDLLARRGVRYCSPAGSAPGIDRGVAVIPFAWPAVDAFHVLPSFAALREHVSGDGEPGGADAVRAALLQSVEDVLAGGGHATLVLHTWMVELELDAVRDVLARVREAVDSGELWAAPCRDVAAWMADHASSFGDPPRLDRTSWTAPS